MGNLLKISLLVVLSCCWFPGKAQLITLSGAVEQAIKNNPRINQLRSQLKGKRDEWRLQTGIMAPEISYLREGIGNKGADPFQEQRISLSQSVDFPLSTAYRLKALREEVKALEFNIQAEEREIKAGVKSRYIEVLYSLYLQKLRDQQMKLATEIYNAVYTRFETGMGNGMDLTKAELQVAEANNDIDDARKQLHMARYGLFNVMGLDAESQKYSIEFTDTLRSVEVDISQIQALDLLTDQPAFKSAQREFTATGFFLKEARSNMLPDLKFSLYKQDYGTGYNFNGFEVGLVFPVWYPFEHRGRINTTLARQDEIRWRQQEIKLGVKKQIEYAWHSYEVSRATIKRYDETIRSKAEKLQSLTLTAYRLGEVDLLNLISAQQIFLNSQERYLSALRDFYIQLVELEKFFNKDLVY